MTRRGQQLDILHVVQPDHGGVAGYVVAACLDQVARGWDVAVACPDGGRLATDLASAGITRLTWRAERSPGPASMGEVLRLGQLINRRRPHIVHLHASKAGLAGRLALAGRLPVVFQPHAWSWLAVDGAMFAAAVTWERMAARWTDLFVCVGDGEAEQGRVRGVRGRYTVVRNGVDLLRFRPADDGARGDARARVGVCGDVPLAVCVGRVTRQKGQDVLISAWPLVTRQVPRAHLAIVGDGDLLSALRSRSVPGVRFAGAVDDVRTWLAAADVVVLPSRWEGLSLTVLEAFATGRSVVASSVPGLAEVVTPSVGALVPPENPVALADAVTHRLNDCSLSRAEGDAAANHAAQFDTRLTFDRLADATAGVVAGRRCGPRTW
jgi:glycosyltransferase involved in cell wall biosynthesis